MDLEKSGLEDACVDLLSNEFHEEHPKNKTPILGFSLGDTPISTPYGHGFKPI